MKSIDSLKFYQKTLVAIKIINEVDALEQI